MPKCDAERLQQLRATFGALPSSAYEFSSEDGEREDLAAVLRQIDEVCRAASSAGGEWKVLFVKLPGGISQITVDIVNPDEADEVTEQVAPMPAEAATDAPSE